MHGLGLGLAAGLAVAGAAMATAAAVWMPPWVAAIAAGGVAAAAFWVGRRQGREGPGEPSRFDIREFTDAFPALIAVLDRDHNYEFVNRAYERLHGKPRSELEGRHCGELLGPEVYGKIKPKIDRALSGERVRFEERFEGATLDGPLYYSTIYIPRTDDDGCVTGFYSLSNNVTRQKLAEEGQRTLEKKALRGQKLESLGALAGGIAHDFNNLLVSVMGNADLAKQRLGDDSPAVADLDMIRAASERAADLCRQMLAYAGKGRFRVETVDLSAVAEEMAGLLRASMHKGVELSYQLADDPLPVRVDVTEIRQVLLNLISNGSEAMEGSSGTLVVRTGLVDASREMLAATFIDDGLPEGRYAFLEIADRGVGMDEDTRSCIFDPFFTTKFTGRGLGLAAVLGIVRSHGGAIDVRSSRGDGTRMCVFLPISEEKIVGTDPAPASPGDYRASARILVVDDEPSVRRTTRRILTSMGFEVEEAEDGVAAVEFFRQRGDEIDLVLLDLTMPRMNGDEAFGRLRALRDDVPIIVFSGYSDDAVKERFAEFSRSAFVEKPFDIEKLTLALRRLLPKA